MISRMLDTLYLPAWWLFNSWPLCLSWYIFSVLLSFAVSWTQGFSLIVRTFHCLVCHLLFCSTGRCGYARDHCWWWICDRPQTDTIHAPSPFTHIAVSRLLAWRGGLSRDPQLHSLPPKLSKPQHQLLWSPTISYNQSLQPAYSGSP
jgi:hypothetical protein